MKEFKDVWRQTSGSCLARYASTLAEEQIEMRRNVCTQTHYCAACKGALLGTINVTSDFKIYRCFYNFISGSRSRRRKRKNSLFLILTLKHHPSKRNWSIIRIETIEKFYPKKHKHKKHTLYIDRYTTLPKYTSSWLLSK
jgi:hypothetical protein